MPARAEGAQRQVVSESWGKRELEQDKNNTTEANILLKTKEGI
jgi:hypothetical protein